ncbi:MAG TPA: PspA/IM30 family protein [Spirochaetota bacterium]|jgi:phage shock protein A|nr:MAG: PspA/IM30 family protein [Spirochaetes bacterium ADurb.Bin133]HNZ26163.1 PspA/IM30 family protein [Spirochaetota bacterium]HPY87361.1 PspA/IM30 family protein [Spirochaetota bacterium]
MGFFRAIGRFFARLFGLGEGALNNAGDKMLTANESTIRAQFRKVREDLLKNHTTVRNAVANLMAINEEKKNETEELNKKLKELETKKIGAVRKFKETNDVKYQDLFKEFSVQLQKATESISLNKTFIEQNSSNIEKYKSQLVMLQTRIEELKSQEAQAVADITSSRQITKLNELLSGLSTDVNMQGLEAIDEARKKALANAKLSTELSQTSKSAIDDELLAAGSDIDEEFAKMLAAEEQKMTANTEERNI